MGNRYILCLKFCCCFLEVFGNFSRVIDVRFEFVRVYLLKNLGGILFILFLKDYFFKMYVVIKMLFVVFLFLEW